MSIITKQGCDVPHIAVSLGEKILGFLSFAEICECGGRLRTTSLDMFGHTLTCNRCGAEEYETDH